MSSTIQKQVQSSPYAKPLNNNNNNNNNSGKLAQTRGSSPLPFAHVSSNNINVGGVTGGSKQRRSAFSPSSTLIPITSGIGDNNNSNNNNNNKKNDDDYIETYDYTEDNDDQQDYSIMDESSSAADWMMAPSKNELWFNRKNNARNRYFNIFLLDMIAALYYNTIVGIGFRLVGNSYGFGLLQGLTFTSMVGLFWNEDFGFGNTFIAVGLSLLRLFRSREYWISLLHVLGHLLGGALAMLGVFLVTDDLPGLQTFGTPTKSPLISETAAGFSEFIATFLFALLLFFAVFRYIEVVKTHYMGEKKIQEKRRRMRYGRVPDFALYLGLAFTAISICFYELTGSSLSVMRWVIPRLCMGNFDLNTHDALYYIVGHFFGVLMAWLITYMSMRWVKRLNRNLVQGPRAKNTGYVSV